MKLRDYESLALKRIRSLLARKKRALLVGPTGSGKTVVGAELVRRERGRILWIAHRHELIVQAANELVASGIRESDVGILSGMDLRLPGGKERARPDARIQVASIDKLRLVTVPEANLVVIDEAHRTAATSYGEVLSRLPGARLLGLTASPWRLDGKGLGEHYDELIEMATAVELVAVGVLKAPRTFGPPEELARQMVAGLKSRAGDYEQSELGERMGKLKLVGDLVSEWQRLASGRRTIVFATSREHARKIVGRFLAAGIACEYIDGESEPAERKGVLSRLRIGETKVVVNVDVLSEGFSLPSIGCVVSARPTRSLTRYIQQCGRAMHASGGKRPVLLDHAGNAWRFGLVELLGGNWSLDGRMGRLGNGEAPCWRCKECGVLNPLREMVCLECGAARPVTETERIDEERRLEEMRATEKERFRAREVLADIARKRGWSAAQLQGVISRWVA